MTFPFRKPTSDRRTLFCMTSRSTRPRNHDPSVSPSRFANRWARANSPSDIDDAMRLSCRIGPYISNRCGLPIISTTRRKSRDVDTSHQPAKQRCLDGAGSKAPLALRRRTSCAGLKGLAALCNAFRNRMGYVPVHAVLPQSADIYVVRRVTVRIAITTHDVPISPAPAFVRRWLGHDI